MTLMITDTDGDRTIFDGVKEFCVAGETEFNISAYSDEKFGKGTLFEQVEEEITSGRKKNARKKHN